MKALVVRAFGEPLQLEEAEIPTPAPDEVLVQVMACGIDAADLMILSGFGYIPKLPHVLGHETAGIVATVGSQVRAFNPGDRVAAYNYFYCGECLYCRARREQLCVNMAGVLGIVERYGGHAEYTTLLERQLVRVPDTVAWPDAAVCCDAGITAVHAVDRAQLEQGETVLVIGIGGVGSVVTQLAKTTGARVVAVDQSEVKAERAREMGADVALNSLQVDITEAVRGLTDGLGADCVIDVVGIEETITYGMDSLRPGGRLVLIGYTAERYPLRGEQLDQNELTIIGTRGGRMLDLKRTVHLVAEGSTKSIVTDLYPLEKGNDALAFLRAGRALGRVVLVTPAGRKAMGWEEGE